MVSKTTRILTYILMTICLLTACKGKQPGDILSSSQMEDLLYDIHLARAIVAQEPEDKSLDIKYRQAVLKKHGVTEEAYEHSLAYYSRHPDQFHEIYKRLSLRFDNNQSRSQSYLPFDIRPESKDTTDIWTSSRAYLLTTTGARRITERIKTNADFKPGDSYYLCFCAKRLARDFNGKAVCLITATYDDGTRSCFSQKINVERQQMTVTMSQDKQLKQLSIDFLINSTAGSTPELLQLSDIALIRIHKPSCDPTTTSNNSLTDSLASPSSDSIVQTEQKLRDKLSSTRMVH